MFDKQRIMCQFPYGGSHPRAYKDKKKKHKMSSFHMPVSSSTLKEYSTVNKTILSAVFIVAWCFNHNGSSSGLFSKTHERLHTTALKLLI